MDTTDHTAKETKASAAAAEAPKSASTPAGPSKDQLAKGIKTVEAWATAKGMLPEFGEVENPRNPRRIRPKAKPLRIHNKDHAPFAAARASLKWPIGMEMTEAEFDKAIADVKAHTYR